MRRLRGEVVEKVRLKKGSEKEGRWKRKNRPCVGVPFELFFSFGTASALRGVTKRHLYYDGRNDGPLTLHLISELACVDVA